MTDLSDLRIVAVAHDRWGCGHMRMIFPFTVLSRHGADVRILNMADGFNTGQRNFVPEQFVGANTIVLQRVVDARLFEWLLGYKKAAKEDGQDVAIIYEADDDLLRVDPKNPAAKAYTPEVCRNVEKIVRACDGLFVSTPELAQAWAHLSRRIFVLPNAIDFSFRDWETPVPRHPDLAGRLVIGWAGGAHHMGDEQSLVGVLPDLLRRHPHVSVAICSNPIVMMRWMEAWGLARTYRNDLGLAIEPLPEWIGRYVFIQPVPFKDYPAILSQFDIGLAPLEPTTFNLCKSELRLLEYGAWGIPYVAERIAPFARFHRETGGLGGYLAGSKSEWREGLERLIADHEDRAVKSAAIRGVVRESYNYDTVGLRWAAAIRDLRAGGGEAFMPKKKLGRNDPCPCRSGRSYKRCCLPAYG